MKDTSITRERRESASYSHVAPLAAATLKTGTTYMMKRHSLCARLLIRPMKSKEGRTEVRMRVSTTSPTKERGKDESRSFGRWFVQ